MQLQRRGARRAAALILAHNCGKRCRCRICCRPRRLQRCGAFCFQAALCAVNQELWVKTAGANGRSCKKQHVFMQQ